MKNTFIRIIVVLVVFLMSVPNISVFAQSNQNEANALIDKSVIEFDLPYEEIDNQTQFYDENGILVSDFDFFVETGIITHTANEKQLRTSTYKFNKSSFTNYLWIKGGAYFYSPEYVSFEKINRTTDLSLYIYKGNTYIGKAVFDKYGTLWHSISFKYATKANYKFKFVSESGEKVDILQGQVSYNW